MKLACVNAIAELAKTPPSAEVVKAYKDADMTFGRNT